MKLTQAAKNEGTATDSVLDKAVKAVEKQATKRSRRKSETIENETEVKTTSKKKTEKDSSKKSAAQAAKKTIDAKIVFQFMGNEIEPKSLLEQAKADYLATGGKEKDIKAIELYIKPEDNSAYYVVNGVPSGKITIFA